MANSDHLNRLKAFADWNSWRGQNADIKPDLAEADLRGLGLASANLSRCNLDSARLRMVDLSFADLREARLTSADLAWADLSQADLRGANLSGANLSSVMLHGADLSNASVGWTTFGGCDLSRVKGLDSVKHGAPSIIGIETFYRSKGHIPETFLRAAGMPETFISYAHSLFAASGDF